MRWIPSALQTTARPRLACALTSEAVYAAHSASPGLPVQAALFQPLPVGAVAPALKSPILSGSTLAAELHDLKALKLVAGKSRSKQVTLVVPDVCVRVLVLDFEALPNKHSEALPLVRFRLRKMLPFDADEAAISYQVLHSGKTQEDETVRVLVTAMQAELREELESLLRTAGFEPGAILPATLASLAAVPEDEAHLLVHTSQQSVSTTISRGNDLLLYRTLEHATAPHAVPVDEVALPEAAPATQEEDCIQAILMAAAFYEDALGRTPDHVLVAGKDSPELLYSQLNAVCDWQIPLRSLVRSEHFLAEAVPNGVPACRFAGVVGALHG